MIKIDEEIVYFKGVDILKVFQDQKGRADFDGRRTTILHFRRSWKSCPKLAAF